LKKNYGNNKQFLFIENCCQKQCQKHFGYEKQKRFFENFWSTGEYEKQQLNLKNFIEFSSPKRPLQNTTNPRTSTWSYNLEYSGKKTKVCREFLLKVLQIGEKRLRIVQSKVKNNDSMRDNRGKGEGSGKPKISNEIWKIFSNFLAEIPSNESHYRSAKTKLKYFDKPLLNLTKLYKFFQTYYETRTGKSLNISLSAMKKHFNYFCNYSFRAPKSDICNLCFQAENNKKFEESQEYKKHLELYEKHKLLKRDFLLNKSLLQLEFDFAQNLPFPRLCKCTVL
jgi:hypothetical protein